MAALVSLFKKRKHTDCCSVEDQMRATIYGNCIGDAMGLLSEFLTKETAKALYGKKKGKLEYKDKVDDMHRCRWKSGDWTDDSDQMILIMDSILDCDGQVDEVDYAKKLLFWVDNGFAELGDTGGFGLGATTHKVVRQKTFTEKPHSAAEGVWERSNRHAAPNGGVMRTSVLGIYQYEDLEAVKNNAVNICKVTHFDPRCQASVIAVTTAIALMLQRPDRLMKGQGEYNVHLLIQEAYDHAKQAFDGQENCQESQDELHKILFCTKIEDHDLADDPKIGYTYKTLGAGFWALQQNDFRKAMETIIFEGGDADTNGAVAGALLGCKLGLSCFPKTWVSGMCHKEWLDKRIERFFAFMRESDPEEKKEKKDSEESADGQ